MLETKSRKYDVIDELIKYELREFLLWLQKKEIEFCLLESGYLEPWETYRYEPIHKAPEDLINEYMEIK